MTSSEEREFIIKAIEKRLEVLNRGLTRWTEAGSLHMMTEYGARVRELETLKAWIQNPNRTIERKSA